MSHRSSFDLLLTKANLVYAINIILREGKYVSRFYVRLIYSSLWIELNKLTKNSYDFLVRYRHYQISDTYSCTKLISILANKSYLRLG